MLHPITYRRDGQEHLQVATSRDHLDILESLRDDPQVEWGSVFTHEPLSEAVYHLLVPHPVAA